VDAAVVARENQPPALTSMRAIYRWVKGGQGTAGCASKLRLPSPGHQLSTIEAVTVSGRSSNS
jgi:hypothetical protein